MKDSWKLLLLFLFGTILILELLQLWQLSMIKQVEKEDFLPMVYENQIYQATMTDGKDIICPAFHTELIKRKSTNHPILVFRYSGLSCKGCVQSCLNELRRQHPDFDNNDRILIVVSEIPSNKKPQNCLMLETEDSLGYDLEDTHVPHFFVYDEQIKHIFIPDQTDSNALSLYLSTVIGRYTI